MKNTFIWTLGIMQKNRIDVWEKDVTRKFGLWKRAGNYPVTSLSQVVYVAVYLLKTPAEYSQIFKIKHIHKTEFMVLSLKNAL